MLTNELSAQWLLPAHLEWGRISFWVQSSLSEVPLATWGKKTKKNKEKLQCLYELWFEVRRLVESQNYFFLPSRCSVKRPFLRSNLFNPLLFPLQRYVIFLLRLLPLQQCICVVFPYGLVCFYRIHTLAMKDRDVIEKAVSSNFVLSMLYNSLISILVNARHKGIRWIESRHWLNESLCEIWLKFWLCFLSILWVNSVNTETHLRYGMVFWTNQNRSIKKAEKLCEKSWEIRLTLRRDFRRKMRRSSKKGKQTEAEIEARKD